MTPEEMFNSSPEEEEDIKPIIFTKAENELWFNEDYSVASFEGFFNMPPGLQNIVNNLNMLYGVVNINFIEINTTNEGSVNLAEIRSFNNRVSYFKESYIKALKVMITDIFSKPKLFLIDSRKLVVEHSSGFIFICPVTLEHHKK